MATSYTVQDSPRHPPLQRQKSRFRDVSSSFASATKNFFGLGDEDCRTSERWNNRRMRLCSKPTLGGASGVKDEYIKTTADLDDVDGIHIRDPLRSPLQTGRPGETMRMMSTASSMSRRSGRRTPRNLKRKDSVLRMAVDGLRGSRRVKRRSTFMHSRTFAPGAIVDDDEGHDVSALQTPAIQEDDVFFDMQTPSSDKTGMSLSRLPSVFETPKSTRKMEVHPTESAPIPVAPPAEGVPPMEEKPVAGGWRKRPELDMAKPEAGMDEVDGLGMRRIAANVLDATLDNSDRREYAMGFVGRVFNRSFKRDRMSTDVKKQIDEMDDHRPYFTYWVTFVQVVIYIVSVSVYGIAPIGFGETQREATVMKSSVTLEQVSYFEPDNFWIGPRQADLIHLGAKYSPCMRPDTHVVNAIAYDRNKENNTACCIRNDGSGCVQSSRAGCSETLSTFKKWDSSDMGYQNRVSGSVCGQDPKYCKDPSSVPPFAWDDDITTWPICKEKLNMTVSKEDTHMSCEVVGHPCCTGIQGECSITTREHCEFMKGYFHEEAFLCSQVNCLSEICGMIAFGDPNKPDQFYRLWTSLFLHAGLFHLVLSILFQIFIMRDMEKMAGCIRIAIIYTLSGIAGNLASAIFLPYQVEAGPAGSQFAILTGLYVEVIQSWQILSRPWMAIGKLIAFTVVLFLLGFLPWIDNYSHLVGFVFGFLLSFALFPYISFGEFDRKRKLISIIVCLVAAVGLLVVLFILFYVAPIYECTWCQYFNCIPFTPKFCKNMEINIRRTTEL
ncbi:unnamed protein product [Owenia fusiformis]|uniref:Peptidase S54 rhomboid domain-containing protein n=1 Tax=Owenia fusiformis TaxID=6347 RepID=A0A8J1U646_OWEFU|nr:unnamed protein product [Owenia fusiformis]